MHNWNKYHGRKYFCRHCMIVPFSRLDLLENYRQYNCYRKNNQYAEQRENFSKKSKYISKFENYKAIENVPFIFVKNLEADSEPIENNIVDENTNTIKLQKQQPNSFSYTLIQKDEK